MEMRAFVAGDREGCLAVLRSNVPGFLDAGAEAEFGLFLDGGPVDFWVAEHDGNVVGCGGFVLDGGGARLRWGMVGAAYQRQGIGRFLLFFRMKAIGGRGAVEMVTATVPRAAVPFYAGQGFREAGASAAGVEMVKRLAVCA